MHNSACKCVKPLLKAKLCQIILVMLFCLWLFHDINVLTHEIEACTIHFCMKLGELSGYWEK